MIGIDIVDFEKFRKIYNSSYGMKIVSRICSDYEIKKLGIVKQNGESFSGDTSVNLLASVFAAKEAIIKASFGEIRLDDMARIKSTMSSTKCYAIYQPAHDENCIYYHISIARNKNYIIATALQK